MKQGNETVILTGKRTGTVIVIVIVIGLEIVTVIVK